MAASIKASTLATSKAGSAAFSSRSVSTIRTVSTPSLSTSIVVQMLFTFGFSTVMAFPPRFPPSIPQLAAGVRPGLRGLFLPTTCGGLLGNLFPPLGAHAFRPGLPAHAPKRHGGGVLAVLGRSWFADFPRRYLADHDGSADHAGGALLAFRTTGHVIAP